MLTGQRVRLRPVERADLPKYVVWLNDPEVIRGLSMYMPLSQSQEEKWLDGIEQGPPAERPLAIEIQTAEGWLHVGGIGFHNVNWRDRSAEVGLLIGEKHFWNQGFGSDALRLMLRYGFDGLNLHRIYLQVYENNLRAIHSYEKVGFVHEGRQREARFFKGKYLDVLWMSILRSEWADIEV